MIGRLFAVDTVSVETFTGTTATGDGYAAPVTVTGFLDDGLVRVQSGRGEELVSKSTFYAALADGPTFAPQSRLTLPGGRVAQVSAVRVRDAGGVFAALAHIEVDLT